jgi:hypothetical protein
LFQVHTVLDLSWDDIQGKICSLRPLTTEKSEFSPMLFLFIPLLCWELNSLYPKFRVSMDLAQGFIRLMQRIENGALPMTFW